MNLSVAEVLKKAGSFKEVSERVQYLKKNESKALKAVIYFTYAKEVDWLIPETDPPYKETTPEQDLQNVLKSMFQEKIERLLRFINLIVEEHSLNYMKDQMIERQDIKHTIETPDVLVENIETHA